MAMESVSMESVDLRTERVRLLDLDVACDGASWCGDGVAC